MATFSIQEALSFGWKTTLKNFWFIFGTIISLYVVSIVISIIQARVQGVLGLSLIMLVVSIVVPLIMQIGLISMFLKIARGEKPKFVELFTTIKPFWRFLGASLIFGLPLMFVFMALLVSWFIFGVPLVFVLIFFVVLNLMVQTIFMFYPYFVIEREAGPIKALKRSAEMTKGSRWALLVCIILSIVLNIVGALVLLVGLFVTVPMVTFATIYIYRALDQSFSAQTPATV